MEDSSRLFMYSRPHKMTPDCPASANMYARTAVISAKLRVLADPRPPYAPRYRAAPAKTGISLGGSSILALLDIRRHQFDRGGRHRDWPAVGPTQFAFVCEHATSVFGGLFEQGG